jgi:hypothetical protein
MAHHKGMGLGAMFLLLVVAVAILPMIVRYIDRMEPHYIISGFENQQASVMSTSQDAVQVPAGASSMESMYHPDPNTDYICRSANGQPCPEGTRCDGLTRSCIPVYVGGAVPDTGYFS